MRIAKHRKGFNRVLSEAEASLVNQMAALTRAKRTEVIKNALAVYHWFIRQAITGAPRRRPQAYGRRAKRIALSRSSFPCRGDLVPRP